MKITLLVATLFIGSAICAQQAQRPPASQTERMYQSAAESAQRKFQHIIANSRRNPPDQTPTVLTEREINAYVASSYVKLPVGVQSVRFHGRPGVIDAVARVDFDQITASKRESNPLLYLFSGTHDVHVVANAHASGGRGQVQIESVDIDGVSVPRMALEFFISHYLTPKYPDIGMTSTFKLGFRVDTATVGNGTLTITQK